MPHAQSSATLPPADVLNEHGVAGLFGRNVKTIRRWIRIPGRLPPHLKLGKSRFWTRASVIAHIEALSTPSGRPAPKRSRRAPRESVT
jgi:hypothetical protein